VHYINSKHTSLILFLRTDLFYVQAALLKIKRVFSILNSSGAVLLEPPKKIAKTFYMCDKYFHLDPILEMFKDETHFGIVFITGKTYVFYKIIKSGAHYENQKICSDSITPIKRHKKGGQSQQRYARQTDHKEEFYIKMLGELVIECYMEENNTKHLIEKLIIAGSGDKKNMLAQDELVQQYFKTKLAIMNTSDLNDQTIYETINNAKELFESNSNNKEDEIIDYVKHLLEMADDKLVFGVNEINSGLKNSELQQIITDEETLKSLDITKDSKCEIKLVSKSRLLKIGINVIGMKWY